MASTKLSSSYSSSVMVDCLDFNWRAGWRILNGYVETRTVVLRADWIIAGGLDAVGSIGS